MLKLYLNLMSVGLIVAFAMAHTYNLAGPSGNAGSRFQRAEAAMLSIYKPFPYPDLLAPRNIKPDDSAAGEKWTDIMRRFEEQMRPQTASSSGAVSWQENIENIRAVRYR